MKVLIVCNKFPYPQKDGGQMATFAMIRGLSEAGHSVTVAAINTAKHYFDVEKLPDKVKIMADFNAVFVNTDLSAMEALKNLLFSKLPYTATRFINHEFSDLLKKLLKENEFDIVQLEGLYMCAYIPLIRLHSKARIGYRAHNVEFEIWKRLASETSFGLKKFYLQNLARRIERFEKSLLNTYDLLIPITQRDGETYCKIGNMKSVAVAPMGIFIGDLPQVRQCAEEEISLFHLGSLDWSPNQQGILWFLNNCWENLRAHYPQLKFYVAGRNAPQWFVDKIQVPGVVYVGQVPDAYEFMAQHSIMVVPLLAGGGMRIKILEGLSYGKVIVTTSIGAEGIPAKKDKEICITDTPEQFVSAINSLLFERKKINEIGMNAKEFVKNNFDNSNIINNLIMFYKNNISR